MARSYRPGGLAKSLLRGVGDVDVAVAGAETRHTVLSKMTHRDVQQIKASADNALVAVEQQIKDVSKELELIEHRHQQKAENLRHRIEQAAAWRSIGVEERIPNLILPGAARAAILALLASLDFYIFAQAYAAADGSIRDWHDPRWWLGGLLGLAVFVVGVVFTHGLKNLIAARAQYELLREAEQGQLKIDPAIREKLVTIKSPLPSLLTTGGIFAALLYAGFELRLQGSATSDIIVTVFQSLIPLVGVAAELYLFDPFHRIPPDTGRRHRKLQKRLARLQHQLEGIQRKMGHLIEGVEHSYGVEHAVLDVEQQDMGLKPSAQQGTAHP
jgi:hypothetical protein